MDALWPGVIVEDNSLSRANLQLRRVLGDGHVVTIKSRGCRLVADVRDTDSELQASSPVRRTRLELSSRTIRAALASAAVATVALVLVFRSPDEPELPAPGADTRYSRSPTTDQRALEFYPSGRSYERMHDDRDPELVARQYQRAVELDPTFALA